MLYPFIFKKKKKVLKTLKNTKYYYVSFNRELQVHRQNRPHGPKPTYLIQFEFGMCWSVWARIVTLRQMGPLLVRVFSLPDFVYKKNRFRFGKKKVKIRKYIRDKGGILVGISRRETLHHVPAAVKTTAIHSAIYTHASRI